MDLHRSAVPRAVWREVEVGIDGVLCEVRVGVIRRPHPDRWVAKLWRNVCSVTHLVIAAALAVSRNNRDNCRVEKCLPLYPGKRTRSGAGTSLTKLTS